MSFFETGHTVTGISGTPAAHHRPSRLQSTVTGHWNKRAHSYLFNMQKDVFRPEIASLWLGALDKFIAGRHSLHILDAGCGPAVMTRFLVDLGHKVTAVDVSAAMLKLGRRAMAADARNVSFIHADVTNIPLAGDCFDLVLSRYIIWTLPDPARAIKEWFRLLKPGGRIGIIDGNWYYHYYRKGAARSWMKLNNLYYRIRSGFDSGQKLAGQYAAELPATHVRRPDWDLGLLGGAGFVRLKIRRDLNRLVHGSTACRFKYLFSKPFWIEGAKPR